MQSKGKWEIYTQLKKNFQRITRREKKAFFNEQCKEMEENNRMGKTSNLFKKVGDIKGLFLQRMDTIKNRNGKDPTESEEIKKRWQEYMEDLYKKEPNDPGDRDGMVIHIEPDILECEVGLRKHYY